MACIRCTACKSVIPFFPSRLVERPLERLHRRLHEEQEQDQKQQDSSPLPQQEVES
jgi:Na+-translocating ferredoxin:NAD+ oxidoreductase RnfC subunit